MQVLTVDFPGFVAKVFLLSILLIVCYKSYQRYFYLSNFRGPELAAWSRLWLVLIYSSSSSADIFSELNAKYGKIVRIGPNHLMTDDPDLNWRILGTKSDYQRGPWFDSLRFDPHYTSVASERDPIKHQVLRRKVSAGYTIKEISELEPVIDSRVAVWLEKLAKRSQENGSAKSQLDLGRSVRLATMDIAAHICFGQDIGFGEAEAEGFWNSLEHHAPYAQYLSVIHWLFSLTYVVTLLPQIKRRMLLTEHNDVGIGRIEKIARIVTEERFGSPTTIKKDMLGAWIKKGLTQHEAQTEISIALVTSAFPTAVAINVVLLHVSTNQRVRRLLYQELDQAFNVKFAPTTITYDRALSMPYLQACIKEALRLCPPITQLRERVVPPGGDVVNEQFIPGGTNIGINMTGMMRHTCFGRNPEVFRPERWLEADQATLSKMHDVQDLIFGYGSTKCLGTVQASMIINKCLLQILRQYDIEVVNPSKPWAVRNSGVAFISDFFVYLHKRN